ncbi:MAG TPA: hypothetical protein VHN14_15765 [Kofleriaceae bacterium]|jgi:hypothetical protein|nr:hypothetical protein [Kofleriaceae bacterium]
MKSAVLVLALVAACRAGGLGGDAGTSNSGGDGGVAISGRVCLLADLRKPASCSATGAKGLVVSLGTRTITIADDHDDGTFTLGVPLGTDLTWHVTSSTLDRIVPSAMSFGTDHTLPVVTTQLYRDLLSTNGVEILDQQGSIVVRVIRGVMPVANVSARSTPASSVTLYDRDNSLLDWNESPIGATGSAGVVWFPGVPLSLRPPTLATITLSPEGGTQVSTLATVENQTITFVTKQLP